MTLITVTQEDINNGKKNDSTCCPIALACDRAGIPARSYVRRISDLDLDTDYRAADFVQAFDEGESVVPFEFEADFGD